METIAPPQRRNRTRGPWVEIYLGTLGKNIAHMQQELRAGSELIFVVKSDAYGHGVGPVVRKAAEMGVTWFAVAYLHEALEIRDHLPDAQILLMGVAEPDDVPDLLDERITPLIVSREQGEDLAFECERRGRTLSVHIKIDSGMGRLGILWNEADAAIAGLAERPGLEITGLCSHFATVEPRRPELAGEQIDRLLSVKAFQDERYFRHVSSSRAFLYCAEWDFEGIRSGIALYGYGADDEQMRIQTDPVLQWKSRVIQIRSVPADFPVGYYSAWRTSEPTDLAVVSVGYADGYPRLLSNEGDVLVHGRRCRVVGRVSMNWITVDLGPESGVSVGDEVVLIGQQGEESVWAGELAKICKTIPYEILTSIHPGHERRYL
ncbi:MAG: alanine racemase [Verrucomicrobiota bacterium]